MHKKEILSSKEKARIVASYNDRGILSKDLLSRIFIAEKNEEIIDAMMNFSKIEIKEEDAIWRHLRRRVGKKDEIETWLNDYEQVLFQTLLECKGVLKRSHVEKMRCFKTDHFITESAKNLVDMGLMDSFKLRNYEVIYVLNPQFYDEAMRQ